MTFGEKLTQYLAQTGETDAQYGDSLEPARTGACVWKWRHGRSEPARPFRRQIIKLSEPYKARGGIYFTAEDFI